MTAYLNGIELKGVYWENQFEPMIDSRVDKTLGAVPLVWEQRDYGMSIDLTGTDNSGALSKSVMHQLQALAAVPGSSYTLNYDGVTRTVRFRNEDKPVIEGTPLVPHPDMDSSHYFTGVRIKLAEV